LIYIYNLALGLVGFGLGLVNYGLGLGLGLGGSGLDSITGYPHENVGFCKCPPTDNVGLQTVVIVKPKLTRIQIACVLNNLKCKLTDIVAGYSIHQSCIRFNKQYSALHSHSGVGRITSMA